MMKASRFLKSGHGHERGLPLSQMYPKVGNHSGSPYPDGKRGFPLRVHKKTAICAPLPGGFYITKHAVGWPFHPPCEYKYYKTPVAVFLLMVIYDLLWGFPVLFYKERVPGKAAHFWFHNNGGIPHHFWCYQDGWYMPNPSGVRRMRE
jgi:hypothetical protein